MDIDGQENILNSSGEWRNYLLSTLKDEVNGERMEMIRLNQEWNYVGMSEVSSLTNKSYPIYRSSSNAVHVCDYGCPYFLIRESDGLKICCISGRSIEEIEYGDARRKQNKRTYLQ
jgi:hypothetical protein